MTASTGKTGKGVMFQIKLLTSPVTWLTVANVRSIQRSGQQAAELDFTHLLSTGAFREYRQGFKDGGNINVEFHFDPTDGSHVGTNGLQNKFITGVTFDWRINFTNAGWAYGLAGSGFVSNPGDLTINVDGPITGSATVRVSGETDIVAIS